MYYHDDFLSMIKIKYPNFDDLYDKFSILFTSIV